MRINENQGKERVAKFSRSDFKALDEAIDRAMARAFKLHDAAEEVLSKSAEVAKQEEGVVPPFQSFAPLYEQQGARLIAEKNVYMTLAAFLVSVRYGWWEYPPDLAAGFADGFSKHIEGV